jgi:hypothetical protein
MKRGKTCRQSHKPAHPLSAPSWVWLVAMVVAFSAISQAIG